MTSTEADADPRSAAPPHEPDVPRWIQLPVRVLAVLLIVPLHVLWQAARRTGPFLLRYVISPVGRFLHRYLIRPLVWSVDRLLWRPLVWVARYLIWRPLVWVARYLIWYPLVWLVRYLVVVPLGWLRRVLAPVARAFGRLLAMAAQWLGGWLVRLLHLLWSVLVHLGRALATAARFGWWLVEVLGRFGYRILLRPIGLAVRWVWRYTIVPIGRAIGWAWARGVVAPLRLLWSALVHLGRMVVAAARFGWWLAEVLEWFGYRILLRPIGLAVRWMWRHTEAPIGRAIGWAWTRGVVRTGRWLRHGVLAPAGRWLRDDVHRPVAVTSRQVLTALGLRRRV